MNLKFQRFEGSKVARLSRHIIQAARIKIVLVFSHSREITITIISTSSFIIHSSRVLERLADPPLQ